MDEDRIGGFKEMQSGVYAIGEKPWSNKMSLGRGNEVHLESYLDTMTREKDNP